MPFPMIYINNPAATINPVGVNILLNARNGYNFPGARIVWAPQAPGSAIPNQVMIGGRRAMFCPPKPGAQTNIALDNYHHMLLTSPNNCDRLLGLASVVYWGYSTFSDNYARNKVSWLLSGHAGKPGVSCAAAMHAIDLALVDLGAPNFDSGLALSRLSQLSGLGQTPFASKVIAFLSPSTSGVYDNKIKNGLAIRNWSLCPPPGDIRSGVGEVSQPRVQRKYNNWCFLLRRVQAELNGYGHFWQNAENTLQQWRAIDVERALFHVFQHLP